MLLYSWYHTQMFWFRNLSSRRLLIHFFFCLGFMKFMRGPWGLGLESVNQMYISRAKTVQPRTPTYLGTTSLLPRIK